MPAARRAGPTSRSARPAAPITFTYDHATHVISDDLPRPVGAERGAHWLRAGVIAWDLPDDRDGLSYRLHWAPDGGLTAEDGAIVGGTSFPLELDAAGLPAGVREQYPHLGAYEALRVNGAARRRARELLTGQLVVAAYDADGRLVRATGVQIPGVLDDLYADAADARLGPTFRGRRPRLAVWAPTAKQVGLLISLNGLERRVAMRRGDDGVWRAKGRRAWRNAAYAYEVKVYVPTLDEVVTNVVTDPYSLALTTNSQRSVLVDLRARSLTPRGWNRLAKPPLAQPEDSTIYELHVRDFSITDETVPAAHRGTYLAFTDAGSAGMRHLRGLARAGMNTLHLLPSNDIATIEEDRAAQEEPACDLASFPPDSPEQQACLEPVADQDGFNWGYDPLHYTTPEGSYATEPDGPARTLEFRRMVQGINGAGLRVVMDVVYNHSPAAGQDPKSILDRVVPGYYQRLNPTTGAVETSTCCSNTASEHRMMEKLMVDSVVTWAKQYKVDGFRFDLMGHHSKANMLAVRRALDALTLRRDGVDGRRIFLYGEGWNFGEVADNARFVQASQLNLAGTGIATFSDRLRDAVRGGGPFDEDPRVQGFASGLFTDPNDSPANGTAAEQRTRLLHYHDLIKLGLAANLRDYTFTDATGATVKGSQVDYNGQPAGYAADPGETITYVDAHDNETLFDALQFKLPRGTSMADRVRMNTVALATTALAQSPSFWHAGQRPAAVEVAGPQQLQLGRLVQPDRLVGPGVDLRFRPPAGRRQRGEVGLHAPAAGRPGPQAGAGRPGGGARPRRRVAADPLLLAAVPARVGAPDPGARELPARRAGPDARRDRDGDRRPLLGEGVVVVFNATPAAAAEAVPSLAGRRYALHPVQARGGDPVVRAASYDRASGTFRVPARTVAVFEAR